MDSNTGMITHPDTSKKISVNLKRQWANGERDGHGDKLKKSWSNNDKRKKQQSQMMTKNLTKYSYEVTSPKGSVENCDYTRLTELGLKSVLSNFFRKKSNDAMCKGFRVIRTPFK
jgi:hypothetical protein